DPAPIAPPSLFSRTKSKGCIHASVPLRLADSGDDVGVAAAAADVAAHPLADLVIGLRVPLAQQGYRGADLSGRAVAALEPVIADERGLDGVHALAVRQPLDGDDL